MKYASIFTARKSSGYKYTVVIHFGAGLDNCDDELQFDTKAECKAYAKSIGAQAYNY